ncbi:hypothetical protein RRG08_054865 [Elysia crispata]|uniref:Uncharacterized protein n=1 Tax=Elysia crispata TaxID=231223 RepID=A0AAE1A6S8_9GAST|nr:hypothetical protein RRG08_054865 [Elysia crispata]
MRGGKEGRPRGRAQWEKGLSAHHYELRLDVVRKGKQVWLERSGELDFKGEVRSKPLYGCQEHSLLADNQMK